MKYILLPIVSVLFLVACSTQKKSIESAEEISLGEKQNKVLFENETQFSKLSEEDSLFASIDKGFCFGTCPVYTINIYKSGFVQYKGTSNVDLEGDYYTIISYAKMLEFVETAKRIEYLSLNNVYDNEGITDLPSTTTSIVLNGERKTVRRRFDYPKSILVFEKVFSEMLSNENWEALSKK